jgi:anti-sigma regulatory factor (Ser/Thr protein kinase)
MGISTHRHRFDPGDGSLVELRLWARALVTAEVAVSAPRADLGDDVELVVSELVTNAWQCGARRIQLSLEFPAGVVRVVVEDDGPGTPRKQDATAQDTHGRGLTIVAALAQGWGVDPASAGKRVWAEFAV